MHKNEEERKARGDIGGCYMIENENPIYWADKFDKCDQNDFHFEIDEKNKQKVLGEVPFCIPHEEMPLIWVRMREDNGYAIMEIQYENGDFVELAKYPIDCKFCHECKIWPKADRSGVSI